MTKRIALVLAALALLALVVGCSKPPEAEMQKANTAMEAARAAEAETYVPDAFRAAMDSLNAANAAKQEQDSKFALFRSYGKAKEMFVRAEDMFNNVTTEAVAEKERVKTQVTQMLAEAKAVMDTASMDLLKAPKGKGSRADIELIKNDLTAAQTGYSEAEADFNAGRYMVAKGKTDAVISKARAIIDEIAKAKAKKMGK
jgi:phage-related tail fiber protein